MVSREDRITRRALRRRNDGGGRAGGDLRWRHHHPPSEPMAPALSTAAEGVVSERDRVFDAGFRGILSPVAYRASSPWKLWRFYGPLLKVHWRDAVRRLASLASGTVFWVGVVIALVLGLNNQIGTWLRVTGLHFSPWFAALRPSARLRVTRRKVRLEKCRIAGW
jgi:hypothetical protein